MDDRGPFCLPLWVTLLALRVCVVLVVCEGCIKFCCAYFALVVCGACLFVYRAEFPLVLCGGCFYMRVPLFPLIASSLRCPFCLVCAVCALVALKLLSPRYYRVLCYYAVRVVQLLLIFVSGYFSSDGVRFVLKEENYRWDLYIELVRICGPTLSASRAMQLQFDLSLWTRGDFNFTR